MTIRPIDIDASKSSPAVHCKILGDVVMVAYNVATLGRIVEDMAFESFAEEEREESLSRLLALGSCINMLAQQIAERVDEYDKPCAKQRLSEETPA